MRLLQDVRRLVEAQALANGDPRRRLSAAVATLRLANVHGPDPLISAMVRGVYAETGIRAARRLAERRDLPAKSVRAACDAPLRGSDRDWVQRAARSDLWSSSEFIDAYLRGEAQICMATPTGTLARSRIVRWVTEIGHDHDHSEPSVAECAAFLEHERRVAELPRLDLRTLWNSVRDLDGGPLGPSFRGTWTRVVERHARRESARALARVALAAAEFREREGRWPESLAALAPMFPEGVPVDPCDGEPFEMTQADGRVRFTARGRLPGGPPQEDDDDSRAQGLVWEFADR